MSRRVTKSSDGIGIARAFTLIEVLVVVAIIALLISILLPSLRAAKEETKKIMCGSNLHQLGIALNNYVSASIGELPVLYRTSSAFTTYYMRYGNVHGGALNLGSLANRRYIQEPLAYYCPGQDPIASDSLSLNGPDNQWYTDAQWAVLPDRASKKVRSSYPARLIEVPVKAGSQIGADPSQKWEPMPSGTLTPWRQDRFYQKVIYSDFTGAHGFVGGGISEAGKVSSPHLKKGFNRLFGDMSVRWIHIAIVEKESGRPINELRPTPEEQVVYYKVLDRFN